MSAHVDRLLSIKLSNGIAVAIIGHAAIVGAGARSDGRGVARRLHGAFTDRHVGAVVSH